MDAFTNFADEMSTLYENNYKAVSKFPTLDNLTDTMLSHAGDGMESVSAQVNHAALELGSVYGAPTAKTWKEVKEAYNADRLKLKWNNIFTDNKGAYGIDISNPASDDFGLPLLRSQPMLFAQGDVGRRPHSFKVGGTNRKFKREIDLSSGAAADGIADMSPVEMINHIGPDWMSNKFDCFFMWEPKTKNKTYMTMDAAASAALHSEDLTDYERQILSHKGFTVRLRDIKIPTSQQDTFDVPFLETKIRKIRSKKKYETSSSFTFRLDQDLVWLETFQRLAGRTITSTEDVRRGAAAGGARNPFVGAAYRGAMTTSGKLTNFRYVIKTIANTWNHVEGNVPSRNLSLVVRMLHLENFIDERLQRKSMPFFVFEDVKILGVSDTLNYSAESADPIEVTVPFIFRRVYPVYMENEFSIQKGLVFNTDDFRPAITDDPKELAKDWEGLQLASINSPRVIKDAMEK